MKKVIVGHDVGDIPNSIIFEPENPSLRSRSDTHYEIVSYGPFQDFQWHIRPPLRPENKVFAVFASIAPIIGNCEIFTVDIYYPNKIILSSSVVILKPSSVMSSGIY